MKDFKTYINEASLSRVYDNTQNRNLGIVTAFRAARSDAPGEEEAQLERNLANNMLLKKDIRDAGYGYIPINGVYIQDYDTPAAKKVSEQAFYVVSPNKGDDQGKLLDFLKQMGTKYGQDSILHKSHDEEDAKLHGTKDDAWPSTTGAPYSVGKWHPNKTGQFWSALRKRPDRTFVFESIRYLAEKSFFSRGDSDY